jgi:RHS repeat-associated protein
VISYAYDALDRRIAVTVDGVTEAFVHDPWSPYSTIANDVLLDFEDGALVRRWLHGPEVDEPLAYERYAGTTAGGSGTALELFRNRLGSVILAVSVSTGAVAAEYDYDSFGQRTLVQGTEEVRYGFTAREHDARTGLIHYRARAYDPLTGRFLQRDPIGFASGDLNLYAYVENDPYNWTDPSGLTPSAGTAVGIQRDSATRGALSPVFSGVLGFAQRLANAMRGYQSIAGTVSAVLNESDDGRLGILILKCSSTRSRYRNRRTAKSASAEMWATFHRSPTGLRAVRS